MVKAINAMIQSNEKITYDKLNDNVLKNIDDVEAVNMIKTIRNIIERDKVTLDPNIKKYLNELVKFDGKMLKDSKAALIFNVFETELYHNLFYGLELEVAKPERKKIKDLLLQSITIENYLQYKLKEYTNNPDKCIAEYNVSCGEFFIRVFKQSLNYISTHLGPNEVKNFIINLYS